ncbi:MAG: ornithine cyclodeaminase family protein, partial [Nanoarchaeota archaeon]|nr:ornithine cyclodeaminase family protein [Nanoarchaeota archaeon]
VLFLSSQEIEPLLSMKDYIETIESAYQQMGQGGTTMLPRIKLDTSRKPGFLKILPASFSELEVAGIHAYTVSGIGTFTKVIFLFDTNTGDLQAVIESDRIGWLVPGALSAVATKYLAKKEARVMGIFGSGRQAKSQLPAVALVRNLELIKVYSPQKKHREQYCEEMRNLLNLNVLPVDSPEEAVKGSEIISTTSNSSTPVFDGNLIEQGTHINAIGAHDPDRRELDSVSVQRSKLVADSKDRVLKEEGEVLIPIKEGLIKPDHIYGELGEVIAGKKQGRKDEKEITLFLSGGIGIEYVAVAARIYQLALKEKIGQELHLGRDPAVPQSLYIKLRK